MVEVEKRIRIHEDGKIVEIVLSDTAQGEAVSATNLLRRLNPEFIELIAEPQVGW
jgi:hypothetical protein